MEEVHERMKILCQFFPEAEPLTAEDEYEDDEVVSQLQLPFLKTIVDLFLMFKIETGMDTYDFESIYWPTDATERPQIRINPTTDTNLYSTQTERDRIGSRTPTNQFLMPGITSAEARWASGDSNGNPKIVSSFQGPNDAPTVRGNHGSLPTMQPLNLDIDPNAWELKKPDLQQLLGNACEYRKAI